MELESSLCFSVIDKFEYFSLADSCLAQLWMDIWNQHNRAASIADE